MEMDTTSPTDTPSESFPYLQSMPSAHELDGATAAAILSPAPATTVAPRLNRLAAFFQLNAVQRCLSAVVLAPLVTLFIWQSPAFATATVCSFVTSACSYEYACIANRIQLRLLTQLDAFERRCNDNSSSPSVNANCERTTSHHSTRSADSAIGHDISAADVDGNSAHMTRSSSWRLHESPSALRERTSLQGSATEVVGTQRSPSAIQAASSSDDRDDWTNESQLQRCAVSGLAAQCFYGHTWLAATVVSLLLSAALSTSFLLVAQLSLQLQQTEFYESRVFYTVATNFVAGLCACYTPNWRYAVIAVFENAVFTVLTMHSTICPINQFSCGLAVEPAQVFLFGAVILLAFRFATTTRDCNTGPHAIVLVVLDVLGYVYIIGSLSVLVAFVDDDKKTLYRKLLIALLYIVWASDTGAYLTGKLLACIPCIPTHPLAAHLSKNKDYEGTLGAIAFGIGAMLLASHLLNVPGSTGTKIAFTVLAVVAGRLGDLFESLLKRAAGVKDSGKLIPGHGGVLDRIDALMFATLVFARYYAIVIGVGHGEQQR